MPHFNPFRPNQEAMNRSQSPRIESQDKSPYDKALNPVSCFYEKNNVSWKVTMYFFWKKIYYNEDKLKVIKGKKNYL